MEHIPTDRPSWMIKSFPASSTTYPAVYRDDASTTILASAFADNGLVTFAEVRFSMEKKSSSFDDGATVGCSVGGRVNLASNANKSANEYVGGCAGAIVGFVDVGVVVGELVGSSVALGVPTGEPLDPGSKSTT